MGELIPFDGTARPGRPIVFGKEYSIELNHAVAETKNDVCKLICEVGRERFLICPLKDGQIAKGLKIAFNNGVKLIAVGGAIQVLGVEEKCHKGNFRVHLEMRK